MSSWGLVDLLDNNSKTRNHKASNKKDGQYKFHMTCKSKRSTIMINLQPYAFAKDHKSDNLEEAKFFARYLGKIKYEMDFTNSRQRTRGSDGDDSDLVIPSGEDYVLKLDSVEFIPDTYECIYDM